MTEQPAASRPQHTMSETCRCGGTFSVTTSTLRSARSDLAAWRRLHVACMLRAGSGFGLRGNP